MNLELLERVPLTNEALTPEELKEIGFRKSRSHPGVWLLDIRQGLTIQLGLQSRDTWVTSGGEFIFIRTVAGAADLRSFVQALRGGAR